MDSFVKSTFNQKLGRRSFVAGTAALLSTGMMTGQAAAAAKVIRISTPGTDTEWQSKALVAFKEALEKAMPGAFDVQIHYNGTLFAQGTEIEAMRYMMGTLARSSRIRSPSIWAFRFSVVSTSAPATSSCVHPAP